MRKLFAILAFTQIAAFAETGVTLPSGFVTHELKSGQFNMVGLTLHKMIVDSGTLTSVSGKVLTDNEVNFSEKLTSGTTYILEILDASDSSLNGTIQEITTWDGHTFTTPQDLASEGLKVGDKYQLRAAATLQQIFGDPAILKGTAAAGSSDTVWIPDGAGGYARYFYKRSLGGGGASWYNATSNTVVTEPLPIIYTDGIMVKLTSSSPDVVLSVVGTVKTSKVSVAVAEGFNLLGTVFPAGATLQNSGIAVQLKSTASAASSDVIWLTDQYGGFTQYYVKTPLGGGEKAWHNATTNQLVTADVVLPSAIFIQRRNTAKNIGIDAPVGYDKLKK